MKPANHRILFTGDCNYLFASDYRHPADRSGPYTALVLEDHIDLLADSGVDTFLINPNGQVPWYPSGALPSILEGYTRGNRDFVRPHYPPVDKTFTQEQLDHHLDTDTAMLDRYLDLVEAGIDWVAHMAAACRRRGVSAWASVRMNDGHGGYSWEGSYLNCPPQREPRFRLSGTRMDPRRGINPYTTVCNFEHQEVRDYYFHLIRELVEEYDFDGLELDWLRMPLCCEPPASNQTIEVMTDWQRQIRDLTEQQAARRGKPYFLGLRIPSRLGVLRTVGLDVAAMAREGIIDFVGLSNSWQTTWDVPYDRIRCELGDDVAVYGVIEDAPNWMFARAGETGRQGYRLLSTSEELIRGNAAGKLAMGVDGVEFFNFFCSDAEGVHGSAALGSARYTAIRHVDDLEFLRGRPKHYALATSYNYWALPFFERAEQLPASIEPAARKAFGLAMCAEPADSGLELRAQVIVDRARSGSPAAQKPELGVSLNDSWPTFEGEPTDTLLFPTGAYTHHVPEYQAWDYRLDLADIREGWNEVIVYHGQDEFDPRPGPVADPIRIVGLELAVKAKA